MYDAGNVITISPAEVNMAKKRVTKKSEAKKRVGSGRPKGSKNVSSDQIEVLSKSSISRKEGEPGIKRAVLVTTDKEESLKLEKLVDLVEKKDSNLMKLISPAAKKRVKKKAKA